MLKVNILAITNGCLPYTTNTHGQPLAISAWVLKCIHKLEIWLSIQRTSNRSRMVLSTGLGEKHWCDMSSIMEYGCRRRRGKIPFRSPLDPI